MAMALISALLFLQRIVYNFGGASVALELDIGLDTACIRIARRIKADGFATQTDVEVVPLGFCLAKYTSLEG
jgi:hypothetical protein